MFRILTNSINKTIQSKTLQNELIYKSKSSSSNPCKNEVSFGSRGEKMDNSTNTLLLQVIEKLNKSLPVKNNLNNNTQALKARSKDGKSLEFFKPAQKYFLVVTNMADNGGTYYWFDTSSRQITSSKFTKKGGEHFIDLTLEEDKNSVYAGELNIQAQKYLKTLLDNSKQA